MSVDMTYASEITAKKTMTSKSKFLILMGGILALSIMLRLVLGTTPDVSWLIDMCARMLDGELAYVDIFETTPPVPVLLYMPGAFAEQMTGIGAEIFVYAYFYGVYLACLWLFWRILPASIEGIGDVRFGIILPMALFLFLLSHDSVAQRETMAAALVLPMLGVLIAYGEKGVWVARNLRFWAAILAGLSAAVKPPLFALPILLLGVWLLWRDRSLRPLWSSGLIGSGIVAVVVTALSLAAYPEYLDGVTQLMRDIYVPTRAMDAVGWAVLPQTVLALFKTHAALPLIMIVAMFVFAPRGQGALRLGPSYQLLALLSAGYILVFLLQGKFFGYHIVPAVLLAFAGLWAQVNHQIETGQFKKVTLKGIAPILLLLIMLGANFVKLDDRRRPVTDFAWAQDIENPTAIAISPDISIGFPLARQIEAQWIDRIHSQWAVYYSHVGMKRFSEDSKTWQTYRRYYQSELERTIALIKAQQPELIIQCIAPTCTWLNEAMLAHSPDLLDNYREVTRQGLTAVWQRQSTP